MGNLSPKEEYDLKKQKKFKNKSKRASGRAAKKTGKWVLFLVIIAAVIVGFVALSDGEPSTHDGSGGSFSETVLAVTEDDWIKGNPEASVTLIEYSDFQCPACRSFFPIIEQLTREFGDQIQFVYRHFPLVSVHPNAIPAARAAEAAGKQGKFWEMHDLLFENQPSWSSLFRPKKTFITYAEEIGLDIDRFEDDFDSDEVDDKVDSQLASALSLGLNSTPSFILNGERIANPGNYAVFQSLIQAALGTNE